MPVLIEIVYLCYFTITTVIYSRGLQRTSQKVALTYWLLLYYILDISYWVGLDWIFRVSFLHLASEFQNIAQLDAALFRLYLVRRMIWVTPAQRQTPAELESLPSTN